MTEPVPRKSLLMLVTGFWILYGFGYQTVWNRLELDVQGTVISSTSLPYVGAGRYVTNYVIHSENGTEFSYTAGPTDASLDRGLPVGTVFKKLRGSLGYWVNNQWSAFPIAFYLVFLFGATTAVLCGAYQMAVWRLSKRTKAA